MIAAVFLAILGKEHSFLVINGYNSPYFDTVFQYWTYLGEGLIWIPLVLYCLRYRRDYLVAVAAAALICFLLTQGLKNFVFPNDLRPKLLLPDRLHIIKGLHINERHSFPSGHTSTAFTLALLMAFIVRRNIWVYIFPLIAFFVGYSRIYLAQHFVTDVFAGILVGVVSSWLALLFYDWYHKRRSRTRLDTPPQVLQSGDTENPS